MPNQNPSHTTDADLLAKIVELQSQLEVADCQIQELRTQNNSLHSTNKDLRDMNNWMRRQLFGQKSERRAYEACGKQLWLGEQFQNKNPKPPEKLVSVKNHLRQSRGPKTNPKGDVSRLKFTEEAQVIEIDVPNPTLEPGVEYEEIGQESVYRVAHVKGPYVVLRFLLKKLKRKESGELLPITAPASVIERSFADVSFLAGMVLDKVLYHTPLHRQFEKLKASGILIDRSTLTNLYHRVGELLEPIYFAVLSSILSSEHIYVDQTRTKATRAKGKMVRASYWGLKSVSNEIAFVFAPSESGKFIEELLVGYEGTIITDGHLDYDRFAKSNPKITHAFCWVHLRRKILQAEKEAPKVVAHLLYLIRRLYRIERRIKSLHLKDRARLRAKWSTKLVDRIFVFLRQTQATQALLPSQLIMKAIDYALIREQGLRRFLHDPNIAMDTNSLERQFRGHAVGRKNWMFHVTAKGARYSGIFYTLVHSCKLNNIDPYVYLIDVLQRIDSHPARDVHLLTPENWRKVFAENPMKSAIQQQSLEKSTLG